MTQGVLPPRTPYRHLDDLVQLVGVSPPSIFSIVRTASDVCVYVHSSALLERVFAESESRALATALAGFVRADAALVTSSLAWVEVEVSRAVRTHAATGAPVDVAVDGLVEVALSGVAPCGTTLTSAQVAALDERAGPLAEHSVITAFDNDPGGRDAALRAFDLLRTTGAWPTAAVLPDGHDLASLAEASGVGALDAARPVANLVVDERLAAWSDWLHWGGRPGRGAARRRPAARRLPRRARRPPGRPARRAARAPAGRVTEAAVAAGQPGRGSRR